MTTSPAPPNDEPARPSASDELDALVWEALTTSHACFAQGDGLARRYDPEVSGFVAIRDGSAAAWSALADLVGPARLVLLAGPTGIAPPSGWVPEGRGHGDQMILGELTGAAPATEAIMPLGDADVAQVLAIVELTRPGPFRRRTIELGNYFGVFDDGRLVAMAGERLQTPRYTEISAVCTHPSARGRGLAAALTHHVATGILARGQTPVLHVAEHNTNAKRVYERLGFTDRARLEFVAVRSPARDAPTSRESSA